MASSFDAPRDGAYRGVPLIADQDGDQLAKVRAGVDAVFALTTGAQLWDYLRDESKAPEARSLAGALLQVRCESAVRTRDAMPVDVDMVKAWVAENKINAWLEWTMRNPVAWEESVARSRAEYEARRRESVR